MKSALIGFVFQILRETGFFISSVYKNICVHWYLFKNGFVLHNHSFLIDLSSFFSTITWAGTTLQPRIRCYPTLDDMVIPIVVMTFLGMIIALFPAWKLKRLRPVDVLKEV